MDENNVSVSFSRALNSYSVSVGWKVVHRYSSEQGEKSMHFEVRRHGPDLSDCLARAVAMAKAIMAEERAQAPRPLKA